MATAPPPYEDGIDMSGAAEASEWFEDILDQADKFGRMYLFAYYGAIKRGERPPYRPTNLHPQIAKLIREEVMEQITMERRAGPRRKAA